MKHFPKRLTISWIKNSYKRGFITPLELVNEIIKRAEKFEDYNIWITKPDISNLAKYIENLPKNQDELPLWGIPFTIKDNIDLENIPTTAGCKEFSYIPSENATVVDNLIKAGAIPIGKTNLDQFATGLVGTRSPYGETKNSLNPELISGGSSSGSAVSVSLGLAAFSLGTDTAGSGRVPAALNCLVGFKPSLGAWSTKGLVPACESLDCITVFSNNIEDAKLVDEYARSFDINYAWSKEIPRPISNIPKKIYIGDIDFKFFGDFGEIYEKKWKNSLKRLENLQIPIEYIDYSIFEKAASILYDGPYIAERYCALESFISKNSDKIFPVTREILLSGNKSEHTASKLFQSIHELAKYKIYTKELLKDAVLIMPTVGGTFKREQVYKNPIETNSKLGLFTNHCNLLDMCAIAIPENTLDYDIPFGITIFSSSENESLILGVSEKFVSNQNNLVAVCGLHKKGYPLEHELTIIGGNYKESTFTAKAYKLFILNTNPQKPGIIKDYENGDSIEVDLFELPLSKMGEFMQKIKAPLCIGDIELIDGRVVKGFLCEEYATKDAKDITHLKTYKI